MKSIGKTYLIEVEKPRDEFVDGIFLPQTSSINDLVLYIGTIVEYGTGFSEEEKKELLPIGTRVLMDYRKEVAKDKIRLIFGETTYYVFTPENLLGVIEEVEDND